MKKNVLDFFKKKGVSVDDVVVEFVDIKNIYSVYDKKSNSFGSIISAKTNNEAKRSFQMCVNSPGSLMCDFPDDYDLYHIGSFNFNSGEVLQDKVLFICNGSELKLTPHSLSFTPDQSVDSDVTEKTEVATTET